jgi:hypothetical protein
MEWAVAAGIMLDPGGQRGRFSDVAVAYIIIVCARVCCAARLRATSVCSWVLLLTQVRHWRDFRSDDRGEPGFTGRLAGILPVARVDEKGLPLVPRH